MWRLKTLESANVDLLHVFGNAENTKHLLLLVHFKSRHSAAMAAYPPGGKPWTS
jgi:hypothetical protein